MIDALDRRRLICFEYLSELFNANLEYYTFIEYNFAIAKIVKADYTLFNLLQTRVFFIKIFVYAYYV